MPRPSSITIGISETKPDTERGYIKKKCTFMRPV